MPNNNETTTKFKVDISELKSAMQEAKRQIKVTNSEFKAISSSMDNWGKSSDGISAKLKQLDNNLKSQKTILSTLERQYELTVQQMGEGSAEADRLKIAINNQKAVVNTTEREISNYESSLKEVSKAEKETEKSGKDVDEVLDDMKDSAKETSEGFTVMKGVMANLVTQGINLVIDGAKQAAAALTDMVKQSVSAYAEYEQLVGGVETLFKDSADIVKGYAENAYKTAGLSGNEYMETVTSFSASLLSSLNGDTAESARIADMAITDMSDNANKMGTDMTSLQNAYNGFAKQNYTMLDNLKLGYGGTKEEMQRLLADAEKLSGQKYDISNLADVYEAIHVIQTEMDITGTTAKEAATTISGSTAMMKASWQNLLVGMADENADFEQLVTNLVDSVTTMLGNVMPRVTQAISGVGQLIQSLSPIIATELPKMIDEVLPTLLDSLGALFEALIKGIVGALPSLNSALLDLITNIASSLPGMLSQIIDSLGSLLPQIIKALGDALPEILTNLIDGIYTLINGLVKMTPDIIKAGIQLFTGLIKALPKVINTLLKDIKSLVKDICDGLINAFPDLLNATIELFNAIIEALPEIIDQILAALPTLIDNIVAFLVSGVPQLIEATIQLFNALVQALPTIINALVPRLPEIISAIVNGLIQLTPMLLQGAIQLFMAIVEALPVINQALVEALPEIIVAILEGLIPLSDMVIGLFSGIWEDIKGVFASIGEWFTGIFTEAWNGVTGIWDSATEYFSGIWTSVTSIFSEVGTWFGTQFTTAWTNIKKVFSTWRSFFKGLWDTVTTLFKKVGTTVADAISGSVKAAVNGVLKGAIKIINGFISALNAAISVINAIPGVKIDKLSKLSAPELAKGGVLKKGQVGLLEGDGAEAVVPLEKNREWIKRVADEMKSQLANVIGLNGGDILNAMRGATMSTVGATTDGINTDGGAIAGGVVNNFYQTNNSPKALSRLEIYRQSKNLLGYAGGGM